MKRLGNIAAQLALLFSLLALLALSIPVRAQQSVFVPATQATAIFGSTTTAIAKLISGISGKSIYLTQITSKPASTAVLTLSYGSGTNCGTGTQAFYGPATFTTGEAVYIGTGNGALFVVPSGKDVCVTLSTAAAPGWLSYSQF